MTEDENRREIDRQKQVLNEVMKEWLDEKFSQFGRWTFFSILAVMFVLFVKTIIFVNYADLRDTLDSAKQLHNAVR